MNRRSREAELTYDYDKATGSSFTGNTVLSKSSPPQKFRNSGVGLLTPWLSPSPVDQGLHFVRPLSFDLYGICGLPGADASASIPLRIIGALKPHVHCNAIFLEFRFMSVHFCCCSFFYVQASISLLSCHSRFVY
jgi:hypothetical protein